MTTYFVSGHLDLTEAEFAAHYVPRLNAAIAEGDAAFLVADARGCDALTQLWLAALNVTVTVFHMFERPRHAFGVHVVLVGGFTTDKARDEAMTRRSDEDIAWVRPGRATSGTAQNLARRALGRHVVEPELE
jgi:hypothetical protein